MFQSTEAAAPTGRRRPYASCTDRPPASGIHDRTAGEDGWAERRLREYKRTGDRTIRNAVVADFYSLAHSCARAYDRTSEPFEDRFQVAVVGLVKAAERFDPNHGSPFVAFASVTVRGELQRHFRDHGWGVRVPRSVQELRYRVHWSVAELGARLKRSPRPAEIAEHLGVSVDHVLEALCADENYRPRTIEPTGDERGAADVIADHSDPGYRAVDADDGFTRLVERCPPRLRHVLELRFVDGLKQREIAASMGISQVQVSRLLRQALATLRTTAPAAEFEIVAPFRRDDIAVAASAGVPQGS